MKISTKLIIFGITATLCTHAQTTNNSTITTSELTQHLTYMASDSLKGRYPGDKGSIDAANYIAKQLNNYQLKPLVSDGYQAFQVVTNCELGTNNTFVLNNDSLVLNNDYRPVGFTKNEYAAGAIVFVGYGFDIETETLTWNDYEKLNVKGKWVIIIREDPEPENMMSPFINYANDRAKVTLAKDKGAIGVLLVNGINSSKKDSPMELNFDQNMSTSSIPVVSITRKVVNKILGAEGIIEDIEKQTIETKKPIHLPFKAYAKVQTEVIQHKANANNLIFEIKAKHNDAVNKYLIIGAHYDHLGMGGKGVSSRMPDTIAVHNGADDNASGVSGIIELAGLLASQADSLKQNILVIAFDAEEMGTLGSKYVVQNSPIPLRSVTAMLNFDMIGRMKDDSAGISIGGTGTALEFDSILASHKPNFTTHFSPDGYGPSDHAPFYSANIPVLFFTTGAHSDYHTPFDDIDKLDIDKETDILNYAAQIAMQIASDTSSLTFQSTGSGIKTNQRTRLKVTLGIIPDVAGLVKDGLGIDGVRTGGPAQKGGILKGDKITAINGQVVTNIYDYMFRLAKLKPETTAIIEIERNGEKQVLLIQL